ncbi:hypothetical protein OEA41_001985 [Lepraria neglecta]|uniref:Ketosynthase family 3 (KS3) domain-containing protein n=1 Tax=Lepraria neglecta TaxID=209136 RepID=A0AAD9ZAM1_9LECA|nr:hypothetical protein OEA41_001985 [Lepraria neglecta]
MIAPCISARTAYHLNLHGPNVTLNTNCASGTLALSLAVDELNSGKCDVAIVGGISVQLYHGGYVTQQGQIFSTTGNCRPFDHRSGGTVPADAVVVVVLRGMTNTPTSQQDLYGIIAATYVETILATSSLEKLSPMIDEDIPFSFASKPTKLSKDIVDLVVVDSTDNFCKHHAAALHTKLKSRQRQLLLSLLLVPLQTDVNIETDLRAVGLDSLSYTRLVGTIRYLLGPPSIGTSGPILYPCASFGGVVGFEMIRSMLSRSKPPGIQLVFLDSPSPQVEDGGKMLQEESSTKTPSVDAVVSDVQAENAIARAGYEASTCMQDINVLYIAASSKSSTDSARVENRWFELLPRMTVEKVMGDHTDVGNAQATVNVIEEWHTSRLGQ